MSTLHLSLTTNFSQGTKEETHNEAKITLEQLIELIEREDFINITLKNALGQKLFIEYESGSEAEFTITIQDSQSFYLLEEYNTHIDNYIDEINAFLNLELKDSLQKEGD